MIDVTATAYDFERFTDRAQKGTECNKINGMGDACTDKFIYLPVVGGAGAASNFSLIWSTTDGSASVDRSPSWSPSPAEILRCFLRGPFRQLGISTEVRIKRNRLTRMRRIILPERVCTAKKSIGWSVSEGNEKVGSRNRKLTLGRSETRTMRFGAAKGPIVLRTWSTSSLSNGASSASSKLKSGFSVTYACPPRSPRSAFGTEKLFLL